MPADPAPNAFYAQSGGVTAVINASAAGVIKTAALFPEKLARYTQVRTASSGATRGADRYFP